MAPHHFARARKAGSLQSPRVALGAAALVLGIALLAACARSSTVRVPGPTRAVASATSTATPTATLPVLGGDPGWQTKLELGYVNANEVVPAGTFFASTVFQIVVACEGQGTIHVNFPPEGALTFHCTSQLQTSINRLTPTVHATVYVGVTADPGVMWRALVEVQN